MPAGSFVSMGFWRTDDPCAALAGKAARSLEPLQEWGGLSTVPGSPLNRSAADRTDPLTESRARVKRANLYTSYPLSTGISIVLSNKIFGNGMN
jgi:hypothetical protein